MKLICKTVEEVAYAFSIFNFQTFSLDTETTDLKYDKLQLEMITLHDGTTSIAIQCNPGTIEYIKTYFNAFVNGTIICHNIVFDAKALHKYGINIKNLEWYDTMVAIHLIDENLMDKKLKSLAKSLLGAEVMLYEDIKDKSINNKVFIDYAINDAIYTYELAQLFTPQLKEQGLTKLFREIEMPFLKVLMDMEINGMLVDKEKLLSTLEELKKEKVNLEVKMYQELGVKYELQCNLLTGELIPVSKINLNSSQELSKILFDDLGLDTTEVSKKTGKKSTGKKTIEKLRDTNSFVKLLDKYRKVQKLITSFYEPLPEFIDSDGRVRPNYRDIGTVTGRLSANNPNVQQLAKENKDIGVNVRSCFIAPVGKKIITCDYSGQEIRVLAQVTQDPTLLKALNDGADLHLSTANTFFNLGIPAECLMETHPEFEHYKKKFKDERSKAKTITFGLAYGKSGYGFAQDFNITEEEGNAILERYFNQFPRVKEAMDECNKALNNQDYVQQLFGRRRRFSKVGGKKYDGTECFFHVKKSYRQAFNFLIQSPSADMIRLASIATSKLIQEHPEWELKIIATVHDELCMECKEEYVEEASKLIKYAFEHVVNFDVPMLCEVNWGENYGNAK